MKDEARWVFNFYLNVFILIAFAITGWHGYQAYQKCEASEGVLVLGVGRFVCVDIGRVK